MLKLLIILLISTLSYAQDSICRSNTCRYGECEQLRTGYSCHCFKGVKGRNCDQLLYPSENPCLQNPCWNEGKCLSNGGDWTCSCPSPFFGKDCKGVTSSPCIKKNPCQNNGICQIVGGENTTCFCINEYTGKFCETKIPLCERKLSCYNGGTCKNNKCLCLPGFFGEFCQTFSDAVILNTLRIKNKGGYTAKANLTYRYNNADFIMTRQITSGSSYTFSYNRPASNVLITVGALAYSKAIFVENVQEQQLCYDIWGALPNPKYTRMNCF